MVAFTVNGQRTEVGVDGNTPLLWVLREHLGLTGTKFGCGLAACGACTVHIDGKATRSCAMPVALVEGKTVTTIEGLSSDGSHPLQKAWIVEQVPQCGYCQSGQIMQAAELLANNKNPTREQIVEHMDGNVCRCGTYLKIISAIQRAAREGWSHDHQHESSRLPEGYGRRPHLRAHALGRSTSYERGFGRWAA